MFGKELEIIIVDIDSSNLLDILVFLFRHFRNTEMAVTPAAASKERIFLPDFGSHAHVILPPAGYPVKHFGRIKRIHFAADVLGHKYRREKYYYSQEKSTPNSDFYAQRLGLLGGKRNE